MSKKPDPEDPAAIDRWTRDYFKIKDEETTDGYLLRTGVLADTPDGQAKRLRIAYEWIKPQATAQSQPAIDQMKAILDKYEDSRLIKGEPPWQLGQTLALPQGRRPTVIPSRPTEVDAVRLEQGQILFEQAKALHRLQPAVMAQERHRQSQSERASQLRAKNEVQAKLIAKIYWDSKEAGTSYGEVKRLAAQYEISPGTVRSYAAKYKPDSIA